MRSVRLLFALLLVVCFIFSLAHGETSEGSKDNGEGTVAQNNSPKIQFPRRRLFRKRINAFADGGAGAGDGANNVTTSVSMSQSVSSSALDSSKPETIAIKPGRPLPKFFKSDRPRIKFFKPEGSLHKYAKSERPLPKYLKTTTTTTTTESTTPTVTNPPQLETLEYEDESELLETESEPEAEPDPTTPKPKPKLQFKLNKEPKVSSSSSTPPPKFVMPKRSFLKPKIQTLFPQQKTKSGVVQKLETETKSEFVLSVVEKEPQLKIETTTEQPKQKPKFLKSERTFSKFVKPERKAHLSVESVPESETQTQAGPEKSRPNFFKSKSKFSTFSKPANKAHSVESVSQPESESEPQPEKSRPKFFKSQRPLPSFLLKRKLQAQTQSESESESGSQLAVEKESGQQKRFFKPSARPSFNKFIKPEPVLNENVKSDRILQAASVEHEQYHREVQIEENPQKDPEEEEEEEEEEETEESVPESTTTSKFLIPPNRRPSFIKSNNKPWMSRTPGFKSKLKSGTSTEHIEREYYATTTARKPTATTASTTLLTTLKPRLNLFSRFQNRPKPPLTYNNKYSSDKSKNDIIPPVTTTIGTNTAAETPNSSFKPKARPNFGRAPTNRPIVKSTLKKLFRPTLRTTATTAYDEVIAEDEAVPENPSTTSTTPAAPTITTTPAAAAQFSDPQRTGTQSTTNTISPTPDYALNAPASQPTEMSASSASAAAAVSVSGSGSGSGSASASAETEAQSSFVESRPSFKNKNMIIIPVPPSQRKPYHPVIMQVTKTPGVSSTEKPQTKVTTYKLNKMFVPMGIYGKVLPKSEYAAANYSEMNAGEGVGAGGLGQFTDTADLITATQGMTPVPAPQKPTPNHNNLFPSSTISPSIRHKGSSSEEQMSVSDSSPVPVEYTTASLRPAIPVSESDSVFAAQEWRPAFSPPQHEQEQEKQHQQQQQQKTKSKSKNSSRERQFFDASKVDLTMNYKPDIASISFTTEKTNIADISLTTTAVPDYLGSSLGQGANNRRENYKNQNSMFQMGPPIPFPKNSNRPNSLMDSIKNAAANAASSIPGLIHGGLTQLSHLSQPFEDTLFGATQANSVKSNSGNLNNPYSNGNNWNAVSNNGNNGNNGNFGNGNNGNFGNGNNGNFGNGNNGNFGNNGNNGNNNGNSGNGNSQNGNQGNGNNQNGNNGNVKGGGANGGGVTLGAPDDETLEYFRKRPHLLKQGLNNKPFHQPSYSSGGFKPVTAPAHFAKAYYASTTTSSPSSHSEATYSHPSSTTTPRPSYEEPTYDSHKPSLLTRSPKNVQEWKDSYVDQLLESSNKYKYATSASPSESDIIKSHWREMSQKYTKNEIDEATNKIYSLMSSSSNPDLDELLYMKPPGQGHPGGPGGLSRSSSASAFHDLLKMFRLGFSYGSVSSTSKPYETTVGALRSRESLHHAASEIESWRPIKSGREPAPFVSFNAGITFGPTPTPSSHPKPRPTPVYSGSGHGGTHYSSSSKPFIPGSSTKNPHGYLKTSGSSSLSSYFGSNLNSYIKGHHHGHRGHPGSGSSSSYHHSSPPPRYPTRPPSTPDFSDVYYGSSTLKGGENGEVITDEDENGYKPPSNLASLYQNDPGIEIIPSSVYYKQKEQGIISSGEIAAVLKPSDMSDESVKARIPETVSNVPQITYPSGKAPQTFQTLNQVNSYFQSSEPTSENQVHFQPPLYRLIQQSLQSQDAQLAYHQQSALQSHQHGGASQSSYKSVQPEEDSAPPSYYGPQSHEQEDQSHSLQYQPPPKSQHGSSHSHSTVQHHHHHQPATVQHHYQPQANQYQAEQQQQQHQQQQTLHQHQYAQPQPQQQHQYQQPQVQQQPQHYQQQHQHQQHSGVAVKATGDSGLGFSDFELPAGVDPDIAALLKAELDKDDIPEEFRKEFAEQEKKQQKSQPQQQQHHQQQHGSASSTSIAIAKAPASLVRTSSTSSVSKSQSKSISAQRREDAIKTVFHKPIPISPTLLTPAATKSRAPVRIPATIPRYVLDLARKLKNDRDLQGIVRVTSKKEGGPPIEYLYPVRGR